MGVAYFYCSFAQQKKHTASYLLSSILRQLLERLDPIPDIVQNSFHDPDRYGCPADNDVLGMLKTVIESFGTVYIVVDALDELQQRSTGIYNTFASKIAAISGQSTVKLFTTSRYWTNKAPKASDTIRLEIRARGEDIKKSLEKMSGNAPAFEEHPGLRDHAIGRVLQVADGM